MSFGERPARGRIERAALIGAVFALLPACRTTVDSLGSDPADALGPDAGLAPLVGPATYPNAFRDVLGKSDADIASKLDGAFNQLFHGDPSTQAIYFPVGEDKAYIQDILHGDVRTEGIGYGMIIAVELNKETEFDALWTFAKSNLELTSGPNQGYFDSFCDATDDGTPMPCIDPFGHEEFVMALLLANDRWGNAGSVDYGADAQALLTVMLHKQDQNGGVVSGVTNMFDAASALAFDMPNTSAATYTRPAVEMPAYYQLWGQATGNAFWGAAALSGRSYFELVVNSTTGNTATGLMPIRAYFTGAPVAGWDTFDQEGYRTQLNLALDQIWTTGTPWELSEDNRLLAFFSSQGTDTYCGAYSLDGTMCLDTTHEAPLVAMNGVTALVSTNADRATYINAVWNMATPSGTSRYYAGILDLLSLLMLSGEYRIY
jgi:oligosaccharide reducing-end xylanase